MILNKKTILIISLIGAALFFLFIFPQQFQLCKVNDWICIWNFDAIADVFRIFISLFLFSLITYFLPEHYFRTWVRFSLAAVPLSTILTIIAPDSRGGGFGPSISIGKGEVALLLAVTYSIVSIAILAIQFFRSFHTTKK